MAVIVRSATGHAPERDGFAPSRSRPHRRVRAFRAAVLAAVAAAASLCAAPATAQNVRLSNLADVDFSVINNLGLDSSRSQDVCAYSQSATNGYNVRASGSGGSGAFTLSNGASGTLDYEVRWNASAGSPSGTLLSPNVPLTGLTSTATQNQCKNGPANSASLIVVIRSAAATAATAGSYTGTLTLVIAPE